MYTVCNASSSEWAITIITIKSTIIAAVTENYSKHPDQANFKIQQHCGIIYVTLFACDLCANVF